jgi:hypothetical protein
MAALNIKNVTRSSIMKPSQFRLCVSITQRLQKHPASAIFRKLVDPTSCPGYYDVVSDPIDLQTVESQLKNREYRSIRQWKSAIKQIWENALAFYGSHSSEAVLARHCDRLFEKDLGLLSTTTLTGWLGRVSELKVVFNDLTSHPPAEIRESCPFDLVDYGELKPFMPEEYELVFERMKKLPEEKDRVRLRKMLQKPKSVLDLTLLPLPVLYRAKEFVEERTPKQGVGVVRLLAGLQEVESI